MSGGTTVTSESSGGNSMMGDLGGYILRVQTPHSHFGASSKFANDYFVPIAWKLGPPISTYVIEMNDCLQ